MNPGHIPKPIPGLRCPKCEGTHITKGGWTSKNHNGARTQRYRCFDRKGCGWHGMRPWGEETTEALGVDVGISRRLAAGIRAARGVRRYVITAAQNATPVYQPFLDTLLAYCKHNDAQLLVIPYRYKNPTSKWSEKAQADDWWATEVRPYCINRRVAINDNLLLLADISTQPTASNPLDGFETISGSRSAVIGHPKLEIVTIPTPHKKLPKIITTTGTLTRPNYVPSKAGKRGEFHHAFAATVVEVEGKLFFMRQLVADRDGSFCDLDTEYSGAERRKVRAEALVMGDWHNRYTDPGVRRATFEAKDSIVSVLKPKNIVWHDFHDQNSRNHHDRDDPFLNYVKQQHGLDVVERELDESFASVDRFHDGSYRNIFPYSNHPNEHLEKWLKETDWRRDPANAAFYLRTALAMVEGSTWTPTGPKGVDPLVHWAERKLKCFKDCVFLGPDDSFVLAGVELAMHGHLGPNGQRGSIRVFGKIGVRSIVGHSHGPGFKDGVMQVGTSSYRRLPYMKGPSSHLHAHGALYPNGKRSLIVMIGDRWRA